MSTSSFKPVARSVQDSERPSFIVPMSPPLANAQTILCSYHWISGCFNMLICSMFRKSHLSDCVEATHVDGLVSDSELRWFWISWQNGVVSYGRGNQSGINSIGWYNDPQPTAVDFIMIKSYDNRYGFWIIPAYYYPGSCVCA